MLQREHDQLHFSGDIGITLESWFIYELDLNVDESAQTAPVASSSLMQLTGRTVASASGDRDGTLVLHFDNGHSITCLDPTDTYESYSIRLPDREIFV